VGTLDMQQSDASRAYGQGLRPPRLFGIRWRWRCQLVGEHVEERD
jgi:hypothetical protein